MAFQVHRNGGYLGMTKHTLTKARDSEAASAVGIGAGDFSVGGHPVGRVGETLFGGKDGEQSGQRIQRKRLTKCKIFAGKLEPVARAMIANHGAFGGNDFYAKVVEGEGIGSASHVDRLR